MDTTAALASGDPEAQLILTLDKIKKAKAVDLPTLSAWNYDACEHHDEPTPDCQYRACGGKLFPYQTTAVAWLYLRKKGLLADAPGMGKSNVNLALLCLLKERGELKKRAVIIVNTPAVLQWGKEAARFAPGLDVEVIKPGLPKPERLKRYSGSWEVLIVGHHMLLKDFSIIEALKPGMLISDDVDPLLNHDTKIHKSLATLSKTAQRVVVCNGSSTQTKVSQLHASMVPVVGTKLWGGLTTFEKRYLKREMKEHYYFENNIRKKAHTSKVVGIKNGPQPLDAKVLTPSGWRNMGDLSVGDCVIGGSTGLPTKVIGVYPQGVQAVFTVRTRDGKESEATAEHLWPVQKLTKGSAQYVLTTQELLSEPRGVKIVPNAGNRTEFGYKPALDPYLIGFLLGDGTVNRSVPMVTVGYNDTEEVFHTLNKLLPQGVYARVLESKGGGAVHIYYNSRRKGDKTKVSELCSECAVAPTHSRTLCARCYGRARYHRRLPEKVVRKDTNPMTDALKQEAVWGQMCHYKHVPRHLFGMGYSDRLALLQGLLDSDGSMTLRGRVQFTSVSQQLTNDVCELAWSLGLSAYKSSPIAVGETTRWDVHISNDGVTPMFRLKRKALTQQQARVPVPRTNKVVSVTYSRTTDVQCILVEAPDHLYVTDNYMTTHNTELKAKLNPYVIRRSYEHLDGTNMPTLMPPTNVWLELHPRQRAKYTELQKGVVKLRKEDGTEFQKKAKALAAYTYGGQIIAGLPAIGEADGPGQSVKLDWVMTQLLGVWSDRKVVVFIKNVGLVKALQARLKSQKIGYATVWGGNNKQTPREDEIKRFWEDPNCRVMIGTSSMERSLNLQIANILVNVDTIPNPERMRQLVGRIRRAGSAHSHIFVFNLFAANTQEERTLDTLSKREAINSFIWKDSDVDESALFPELSSAELLDLISG